MRIVETAWKKGRKIGAVRHFSPGQLTDFALRTFASAGLPQADAATIPADLVKANLRGLDSHGIARIPMYRERLDKGLVNPRPNLTLTKVAGAVAHLDADNGMGLIASHRAMDAAMDLAADAGIGMVGVHRSTHFGMGALYVLQALERNFVSMVFINSSPALAMWGGHIMCG